MSLQLSVFAAKLYQFLNRCQYRREVPSCGCIETGLTATTTRKKVNSRRRNQDAKGKVTQKWSIDPADQGNRLSRWMTRSE